MSKRIEDLQRQITDLEEKLPELRRKQRAAVIRLDVETGHRLAQEIGGIEGKITRRRQWLRELRP